MKRNPYPQMEILQTKRCILRPVNHKDIKDLFDYYKEEKVVKYLPFKKHKNLNDTKKFVDTFFIKNYRKGKIGHHGVILKSNKKLIGNVGFNNIDVNSKEAEIGICINPKYWGDDLATELTKEIIRYGFEVLDLQNVYAVIYNNNKYSKKSLENLGFIYTNSFNKSTGLLNLNGKITCHRYDISKDNYLKQKR